MPVETADATLARLRAELDAPAIHAPLADILARLAARGRPAAADPARVPASPHVGPVTTVKAAQRLNRAAAMLASSVLLDSAVEHYRGAYENPAMVTPLVVSALTLAVSAHGVADRRPAAHVARDVTYALAAATGVVGTAFHVYNVVKRPGRLVWQNLFYGAPLGAPAAIALSGALGVAAERTRNNPPRLVPRIFGLPAGRMIAAITGLGLLGTSAEAGLLHFRGAYHNPFMFLPVTMPPVAALLMGETAVGRSGRNRWFTLLWLRLTAALGIVGAAFHAYGVGRNMGGWRNWRQNLLDGPPVPAPPAFTGLALAGLAGLGLLKDLPDV